MQFPSLRASFVCLLSALGLIVASRAVTQTEVASGIYADTVDVRVVNVEVFVTDKKGRRVEGLTREDFELRENGKPVEITNFYAVAGSSPSRAARPAAPPGVEPSAPEAPDETTRLGDQQLFLVIYVDNFNSRPLTRNRALRELRAFLVESRFGPDDRFMVVSYDRSLNERHPPTTDKQTILSTLFEIESVTGHGRNSDRERRQMLDEIYDAEELGEVSALAGLYADSVYHDLNESIDALKQFVDSLAGLPGRKAVIYLSDGISMRAGEDIFTALSDRFDQPNEEMRALNYDASRRFRTIANQANANRITLYAVDASGLRIHGNADVQSYHAERGSEVESVHVSNLQDPLFYMANETGGQVIANTNNFEPLLARFGDDFSSYYSLGFTPTTSGTGRYRSIEVKVKGRKNLKIRHREGYRDKSLANRISESTLAALRYGVESNPLGVELKFGPGSRQSDDRYLMPIVIEIPMRRLSFFPAEDRHRSLLRLYLSARNEEGEISPVEEISHPIDIPQADMERAREHSYELRHTLMMRPGRHLVAIGVRDEIGAVTSVVVGGVTVGL